MSPRCQGRPGLSAPARKGRVLAPANWFAGFFGRRVCGNAPMLRRVLETAALITMITLAAQSIRPIRAMEQWSPPAILAASAREPIPTTAYRPTRNDSLVVFGAHPDDEILGAGGLIHAAIAAGARVRVVTFTNGDGYIKGVDVGFHTLFSTPNRFIEYGRRRQQEGLAAGGRVGLSPSQFTFLGYPDRGLAVLWGSAWDCRRPYTSPYTRRSHSPYALTYRPGGRYCGENVFEDVERVLLEERPTIIVTHHPADTHRDHWAAGAFVAAALEQLTLRQVPWTKTVRVWHYLVHNGVWPRPGEYTPDLYLTPPPELAAARPGWAQYPIGQADEDAKRLGILEYRSQVDLKRAYMLSFVRRNELFAVRPPIEATRLDGEGLALATPEAWARLRPVIRVPSGGFMLYAAEGSAKLDSVSLARDSRYLYVVLGLRNPPMREGQYRLEFRLFSRDGRMARLPLVFRVPRSLTTRGNLLEDLPFPAGAAARTVGSRICVALPLASLGDPVSFLVQAATVSPLRTPVDSSPWILVRLAPPAMGVAAPRSGLRE